MRVEEGSYHGIIGESGSGKSIAMMAIMGLLGSNARVSADRLALNGEDILMSVQLTLHSILLSSQQ